MTKNRLANARIGPDRLHEAECQLGLTTLLLFTERNAEAVASARQELRIRLTLNDPSWTAAAVSSLAMALFRTGLRKAALIRFREAHAMFRALDETQEVGTTLANIGELLLANGQHRRALKAYIEALPLVPDGQRISLLGSLVETCLHLQDIPSALSFQFDLASETIRSGMDGIEAKLGLAALYVASGQKWEARELLKDIVGKLRSVGRDEEAENLEMEARRLSSYCGQQRRWERSISPRWPI